LVEHREIVEIVAVQGSVECMDAQTATMIVETVAARFDEGGEVLASHLEYHGRVGTHFAVLVAARQGQRHAAAPGTQRRSGAGRAEQLVSADVVATGCVVVAHAVQGRTEG
jgi:hypothetical protein